MKTKKQIGLQEKTKNKKQALKSLAKSREGITLIALVVTIVVLLILAGITITMVLGEDGILSQAKLAAEKTKQAEEQENENFNKLAEDIKNWVNGGTDPGEESNPPPYDVTTPNQTFEGEQPSNGEGDSVVETVYPQFPSNPTEDGKRQIKIYSVGYVTEWSAKQGKIKTDEYTINVGNLNIDLDGLELKVVEQGIMTTQEDYKAYKEMKNKRKPSLELDGQISDQGDAVNTAQDLFDHSLREDNLTLESVIISEKTKNSFKATIKKEYNSLENLDDSMFHKTKTKGGSEISCVYVGIWFTVEATTQEAPTPGVLKVGSEVKYNPSGTYNWQAKYCSSDLTETSKDVQLSSATGAKFNISSWKVLSIDEGTGNVELVPSAPTTGTVRLQGAQGYNNAVKLLNDACSNLYGNEGKNITARSINIEDIEKYMKEEAIKEVHALPYNTQPYSALSQKKYIDYPAIYAQENKSVINGQEKTGGLGMSSQDEFIERNASVQEPTSESGKVNNSATYGRVIATTSIHPYKTIWSKGKDFMKTAFKDYEENTGNYYDLIMPKEGDISYWVASRGIRTWSWCNEFLVREVTWGVITDENIFQSGNTDGKDTNMLFPIVTLNSELIEWDGVEGFEINQ